MKKIFIVSCLILGIFGLSQITLKVLATEQVGSSPTSTSDSRIKILNDALTVLDFGSTAGGGWGDWGAMWNRIYSAGIWNASLGDATAGEVFSGKKFYAGANRTLLTGTFSFTGDATTGDVAAGKTFYADSSTKQTGTGATSPAAVDYSLQQYSTRDDYGGPDGSGAEDYQGEESTWTSSVTNVWKDTRTGLYWSDDKGSMTNSFTAMSLNTCDFFNTTLNPVRGNYAGGDADCGVAINYCATLDFGSKTDWYLPTQKELMQAYIDGMYNKAGTTLTAAAAFATANYFWSSSEEANSATYAWIFSFSTSRMDSTTKTSSLKVRCVRRD